MFKGNPQELQKHALVNAKWHGWNMEVQEQVLALLFRKGFSIWENRKIIFVDTDAVFYEAYYDKITPGKDLIVIRIAKDLNTDGECNHHYDLTINMDGSGHTMNELDDFLTNYVCLKENSIWESEEFKNDNS